MKIEAQADGTLTFRLRFGAYGKRETIRLHEHRDCDCDCGGGWTERTAQVELQNILTRVQAGIWERPKRQPVITEQVFREIPTFHEYASYWLRAKVEGVLGDKPVNENTHADYRSRLRHLLSFFGRYRLDEIDRDLCLAFKAHKIREAQEIREALAAGADLRDERNRKLVPLAPVSIKRLLGALAAILDEAVEDELIEVNPARSRRLKIHVPKPKRTFLEMDELACIEDAAGEQDPSLDLYAQAARAAPIGSSAAAVAVRLSEGKRQAQIVAELGLTKSTVSFHVRKLGALRVGRYVGREAIICTLGRSGVRNSELCDMRIGHLRLHDPEGARFRIPDAKTETGIRDVEVSPYMVEVLIMHIDRLRRAGNDTSPDAWLFQNERGGRMARQRVGEIVLEASALASEKMRERGLPPLPHITPHSLRRTYISISLLSNEFDVKWVMDQVGHADSKMTMDVYAQLQQRAKREHGASFDRLMRKAREQLYGRAETDAGGVLDRQLDRAPKTPPQTRQPRRSDRSQNPRISREITGPRSRDSNSGHRSFQSCALPAELSRREAVDGRLDATGSPGPRASERQPLAPVRSQASR
ncbi:MAG: tyrosine-type recombinase/integrase [Solirubrobacterales bacterium]|nr:tyrosine-type recombinase/integrase [Solirubrobacterales bacterium]